MPTFVGPRLEIGKYTFFNQSGNVATVTLYTPPGTPGAQGSGREVYRVTVYTAIARAATTSLTSTVTIGYTDETGANTAVSSAFTTNTLGANQTYVTLATGSAALTFATTASSVGATQALFNYYVIIEPLV